MNGARDSTCYAVLSGIQQPIVENKRRRRAPDPAAETTLIVASGTDAIRRKTVEQTRARGAVS